MPSKLLIAAAEAAYGVTHAAAFGVRVDPAAVIVDGPAVMQRVQRERDRFVGFVVSDRAELPAERVLTGRARFTAPTTLEVAHADGSTTAISAGAVVVATGSVPRIPPEFAALVGAGDRLYTNDQIFERADLPRSLAVIGTGVIGLELGQAFHRLGVRTTLFARHRYLGGLSDPAVRAKAESVLATERDLRFGHVITDAQPHADGVCLDWRDAAGTVGRGTFEAVLIATGREANVAGLGLETTGVALGSDGVPRHDPLTLQCGDLPIFLAGDVTQEHLILHEAADDGRAAGRNAAHFPVPQAWARRTPIAITFCDPELARAGLAWRELDARFPNDWTHGAVSYDNQGRSRMAAKNAGLVHIYAQRSTGRLLGAELCAPRAEHLAHLLAWAIQDGHTASTALGLPFYHPVYEEGLRTALQDLARKLDPR
jgi:dihydrolipoamide dehydrogenase